MTGEERYDVIVVGAGSAGSALAARLSEDPSRRVLLLEAGPDHERPEDFPPEVASAGSMAASFPGHPNNWSFVGELQPGRTHPLARGKVVGGSSAINGAYWIRATRDDFDEWVAAGNDLWSYEHVLPYFRRSERDLDREAGSGHGEAGPVPIRRPPEAEMRPVSRAFTDACREAGFAIESDKNADGPEGVGPIPRNVRDGMRMNTAMTYLADARQRPNLTVLGGVQVRRVLFEGTRAVGVEADRAGRRASFAGDEVVLSAGGIKSPQLLLLSGIGPADELRSHGIDVVHDSPGVGKNVKDHPSVFVYYRVRDGDRQPPVLSQVCLNHTAPGSDVRGDLQIICGASSLSSAMKTGGDGGWRSRLPSYLTRPWATLRALRELPLSYLWTQARLQGNYMLYCSLDGEKSAGEIVLRSANPSDPPTVRLNYLSHPDDLPRLVHNVRLGAQLVASSAFAPLRSRVVDPSPATLASDEALAAWVQAKLGTSFHSSSGARMGPATDPMAVVDQQCRVRGVEGLRVVDISIMPNAIRRGPAATAVMIGERASAFFDRPPAVATPLTHTDSVRESPTP